ncbi:MAG: TRAP transporter small permease [Rhodospirillaceae bacterium]|nr:TRAP transporter small permease [Rhodospirillaceae bacterium]
MKSGYRRAMDALYLACIAIAGVSLVIMTVIIPWGVYTRYVLNRGSAWPEPMAVLLMILFTFFGGAACYRAGVHISVGLFVDGMPAAARRAARMVEEGLMAALALFMAIWGFGLVDTTWRQVIGEFPWLSVGITYLPIPLGGIATLAFILERVWLGPPPLNSVVHRQPSEAG